MQLYHNANLLGLVTEICANGFDMHGLIELTPKAENEKYQYLWASEYCREGVALDPPEEIQENWFMVDEAGRCLEIGLPGIFAKDGQTHIMWRWY
jgi:hypothetical protein